MLPDGARHIWTMICRWGANFLDLGGHGQTVPDTIIPVYNTRNPAKPLGVKLRVWGGFEAPDWAKEIGGAPVDTVHRNKHRTVGRFWSPDYRQAWASLQQQLAARFDKQPLIREVSVTSCMSFTAEPFFVPIEDTVMPLLRDGGFTDQAYKDCLTHALGDYAPWKQSRLVLSVNPLRTAPGQGPGDPAFTEGVMRNCRQVVGRRCVFDNHDLDTTSRGRSIASMPT
jgi:hypothetical protein